MGIGDLVRPNEKAINRNKEVFSKDQSFVICEIEKSLFSNKYWLYLGASGDNAPYYSLPEDEVEVVRPMQWSF